MEKIIYKVNVCHMADGTVKFVSAANRKKLGIVSTDYFNKGKYSGTAMMLGTITNAGFTDAVQYVHDRISEHFAEYGIETEFIV